MTQGARTTPTAGEADESLIERFVRHRDLRALDEIIRRYTPRLRRLLATLLRGTPDEICDSEQEVFLTLVQNAHRFDNRSSFSTFFYALARNRVLDLLRSRKRYVNRHGTERSFDLVESHYTRPDRELLDEERKTRVRTALETLKPADRFLLYMKEVEDMSVRRLAEITGARENTIKSRLKRSRDRLAVELKDIHNE